MKLKVALVYDWVTAFGGAERLLLALHEVFPEAPLYTGVYRPSQAVYAKAFEVRPQLTGLPSHLPPQLTAWLFPSIFEDISFNDFDVVITVSSGPALSVITPPGCLHLAIVLTPSRYFWHLKDDPTVTGIFSGRLLKLIGPWARAREYLAAQRPDHLIAISKTVANRIRTYYRRTPKAVIYPPVVSTSKKITQRPKTPHYLVVSRLVAYKRVEAIIEAANTLGRNLTVVGDGPKRARLTRLAGPTVKVVGSVSEDVLDSYYDRSTAVIYVSEEDFGIVPVEALVHGRPVLCLDKGGASETIQHGVTGVHIASATPRQIADGMIEIETLTFDGETCQKAANRFSMQRFTSQVSQLLEESWAEHQLG